MCCVLIVSYLTEWKEPVGWELTARGGKGSKFVDLGQSMDPIKYVSTVSRTSATSLLPHLSRYDGVVFSWNLCDRLFCEFRPQVQDQFFAY
jgi:hypothetical protein